MPLIRQPRRQDTVSVGYKLYREIRDFAPPGWTFGELIVAWVIADDANEDSRRSFISNEKLCSRTRMTSSGVRAALARLARRGFEFRVYHGYDKNGDPVFAMKGRATDYLVPDMPKGATTAAPLPADDPPKGATTAAPLPADDPPKGATTAAKGATTAAPLALKGATAVAPLSSVNLNHLNISSIVPAKNRRHDVERICAHLADRIESNGSKRPPVTDRWRTAARLMLDRDGRTENEIRGAIDWCQADEFWRSNILSMPKLREKYDQLRLQAIRGNGAKRKSTTDERVRMALEAGRQVDQMLNDQMLKGQLP
jgi:hypothetical protein